MPMLRELLQNLFAKRCVLCHNPGTALCRRCSAILSPSTDGKYFALYDYSPIVKKGIRALKYHHRSSLVRALTQARRDDVALWLSEQLLSLAPQHVLFVPIPLSRSRRWQRGFNQSALIARWLGHGRVTSILKKIKHTVSQVSLQKYERQQNLQNTMEVTGIVDPHALYVIVDDVTTTGATFTEAVRALTVSGAKHVCCLALAHGSLPKRT
jgi:ComF family protein